jgi:hypothetical protein
VLAYNQHDWCYTGGLFTFEPARLYETFDAHARSLIEQLPPPLVIARRTPRRLLPFHTDQRDRRRLVEAILDSNISPLAPLATHLAGDDLLEQRVANIAAALERLVATQASDDLPLRHPFIVLRSGTATPEERGVTLAALLRALDFQVGILSGAPQDSVLVPMILTPRGWCAVEAPCTSMPLGPLIPKRLHVTPGLLGQPQAVGNPHTVWNLLTEYRECQSGV